MAYANFLQKRLDKPTMVLYNIECLFMNTREVYASESI